MAAARAKSSKTVHQVAQGLRVSHRTRVRDVAGLSVGTSQGKTYVVNAIASADHADAPRW